MFVLQMPSHTRLLWSARTKKPLGLLAAGMTSQKAIIDCEKWPCADTRALTEAHAALAVLTAAACAEVAVEGNVAAKSDAASFNETSLCGVIKSDTSCIGNVRNGSKADVPYFVFPAKAGTPLLLPIHLLEQILPVRIGTLD